MGEKFKFYILGGGRDLKLQVKTEDTDRLGASEEGITQSGISPNGFDRQEPANSGHSAVIGTTYWGRSGHCLKYMDEQEYDLMTPANEKKEGLPHARKR